MPSCLHLAQHLADPSQLGRAQEPLALFLRIFLDVLARVRSIRPQAPHLGEVEHLGDHLQAAIGVVGDVPEIVMELGDVGARDLGHAVIAEPRNDKPLQHPLVALGGARLEAEIDVLFLEPLGEFLDGDGPPVGIAPGGGIVTVLGRGDDADRPVSGLLTGEDGARPEADAARSSPSAVLYNVSLATTGQDPQSEAGQVLVPDEVFARSYLGGIDDALGEFRHQRSEIHQSASCRTLRSIPEALWKQEGASRGACVRKRRWSQSAVKSTKSLKMRRKRKLRAILRSALASTHNLKVARFKS